METQSIIKIYETNGVDEKPSDCPKLIIRNHWNDRNFVVIELNGTNVSVLADELIRSITNAQNAKR